MEKVENVKLQSGFYDLQDFLISYVEDFMLAVEYSRNADFRLNKAAKIKKVSKILKDLKKDMKDGIKIVDWQLDLLGKEQENGAKTEIIP